jgi:2'-5' RNA ligase
MTEEWARRIGLPPENRSYSPHITLGRVARPSPGLHELTNDIISRECQSDYSRIGEIVLMRSVLSGGGARYEESVRFEV